MATSHRARTVLILLACTLAAASTVAAQTITVYENSCRQVQELDGAHYFMKFNFNAASSSGVKTWTTRATVGGVMSLLYAVEFYPALDGLPPSDPAAFTIEIS